MGKLMTLIGTLIIIGIIGGVGYFSYSMLIKTGETTEMSVRYGDTIHVNYIGKFENGKIFDTSLWNVAKDNITYPKAVSFTMRGQTQYTPFNFTVGTKQVIKGWEKGTIDMKIGQTKILNISKEDAYGNANLSLIKTLPLVAESPIITDMNRTLFKEKFTINPSVNVLVKDPIMGWSITVISVSGEVVKLRANPVLGQIVHPYRAWDSIVIDIDSAANGGIGVIKVKHLIKPEMVNNVKDNDQMSQQFRLTGLSTALGTYTIDYNQEVTGKTLIFTITLLKIIR